MCNNFVFYCKVEGHNILCGGGGKSGSVDHIAVFAY